jgi:hypothetical protein
VDTKRRSRRGTGSSIRCAALLLAFAVAAPARAANQLEAVATLQYQSTLYGGEYKSDSFWQFYRLGWANPDVTSVFGYNLGLNYEDQRGPLVAPGAPVYYRSLSPRMTLNYGNGPLSLNLIYVFNWAQNDLPQLSLNSYVHSLTIAAGYQPSLAWNLSARYSRIMNSGPEPGASSISDVGSASASYGVDVWSAGANVLLASNQSYSFDLPGVSQLRVAPGLSASFNPVLIPDRLSMSVAGNASYSWSQTTVQGGGPSAVVPVQLLPVAGLYANVNPPNNTTLTPMTPLPSLIDRDIDTSTGVDLGPTGMSYQNIGVDMGRLAFLDSFYVYVRDASGRFVPSPGPISWTAWSSQDGNQWTPLASTYVYDQGLSRFVVTFTSVEARYFKVVSFDVNLIPTFVTELTPLIHQVVTQAVGYLTSGWSVNANAGLSYHPVSQVSMNYNIGVNNSASSVPGVSNATRSWTQGGDVSYAPTNLVSGSISGECPSSTPSAAPRSPPCSRGRRPATRPRPPRSPSSATSIARASPIPWSAPSPAGPRSACNRSRR